MYAASDHRFIAKKLDLFHLQEEAPGMVFWHPRGLKLLSALRQAVLGVALCDGFEEVQTPQLLRSSIWEASGHWTHFREGMFVFAADELSAAIKPVSCPGHLEIFRRRAPSYRDLPLRYAEFGVVHRNEPSGTLHGLFRLRQFTQDDGHVFCTRSQVHAEIARFCDSLRGFYGALGFESVEVAFATRPELRAGSDAVWDEAEALLADAARAAGVALKPAPGAGAFYGPKLEFSLGDRAGRRWQCGTIQLDLILPERFDVSYVAASGARERPVMLHRAVLGSLERFLGVLLEQSAGKLPGWLAPEQAVVVPVTAADHEYAARVLALLHDRGLRARADLRNESLSRRVRDARTNGAFALLVVGRAERESEAVTLSFGQRRATLPLGAALEELVAGCRMPSIR